MQAQVVLTEEEYYDCCRALDNLEHLICRIHHVSNLPFGIEDELWNNYRTICDVICPGHPVSTYEKGD